MEIDDHPTFPLVRGVRVRRRGFGDETRPLPFPEEYGDWLFVGTFNHDDLQSDCNFKILLSRMMSLVSRDDFKVTTSYTTKGDVPLAKQSFLIIRRESNLAMVVARDSMEVHNNGEHLSDEFYWKEVNVHLARMWEGLSMPERMDAAKRTNTPSHVVLENFVSEDLYPDLWTYLYQDMGI